jgi:hypothetical protein
MLLAVSYVRSLIAVLWSACGALPYGRLLLLLTLYWSTRIA